MHMRAVKPLQIFKGQCDVYKAILAQYHKRDLLGTKKSHEMYKKPIKCIT